ncbi:MAG: peptide deformylase, partial [Nitrospirota bacterium]
MPTLRIAKLGNPVLRQIAAPVDPRNIRTYEIQQFIDNLIETMLAEPGIGLAAPQVSR